MVKIQRPLVYDKKQQITTYSRTVVEQNNPFSDAVRPLQERLNKLIIRYGKMANYKFENT